MKDGFVNPELLSWHLSGAVLIMIILGGLGHLRGALIGAFAFALLQEFFKSEAIFGALRQALAARPRAHDHRQRGAAAARPGRPADATAAARLARRRKPAQAAMTLTILLRGASITRRLGGLVAVDRVSIELAARRRCTR